MSETRWLVLATDGRHATFGRYTDPSEEEILAAEKSLRASGVAGWLAVMKGNYHIERLPEIMMVRPLADPNPEDWNRAVAAFQATRLSALKRS